MDMLIYFLFVGRRKEPPTDEEVMRNVAMIEMKKRNAIEVEAKAGKKTPLTQRNGNIS